jgi:hypothetical protein
MSSGENPFIRLSVTNSDNYTTNASFWRTIFSPAYHALPKAIRRRGNTGGGAIVGFANFLLRLYETDQPRAVLGAGFV